MKRFLLFFTMLFAMTFIANAQTSIYVGDGTETSHISPINTTWNYSYQQLIYTYQELNAATGLTIMPGLITEIGFFLAESYDTPQTNYIEVYMENIHQGSFTGSNDYYPMKATNQVYSGNWTIPANYTGWVNIPLDDPFVYDGYWDLLVGVYSEVDDLSNREFFYTDMPNTRIGWWSSSQFDPIDPSTYPTSVSVGEKRADMGIFMEGMSGNRTVVANFDEDPAANWTSYGVNDSWYESTGDSHGQIEAYRGTASIFIDGTGKADNDYFVSPQISFHGAGFISFAYATPVWSGDQNELSVAYGTSPTGPWTVFSEFNQQSYDGWTSALIDLDDFEGDYYIAFISYDGYGYCTALDDIIIYAPLPIDEIYIDGFSEPVCGQLLDFDVTARDSDLYDIYATDWWWGGNGGAYVPTDHIVQNTSYYNMNVILSHNPDYYFNPNATVYFNGDASLCDSPYSYIDAGYFVTFTIDLSYDGINDISANRIGVYPNPANDVLHINGLENATEVSIYNAVGALVKVVNTNESINISDLASGLYIARFGENSIRFTKE